MVSNTSTNKAPQKKAVPDSANRGGKAVAAATVDKAAKRAAKKKADDVVKKAVKKTADEVAKKASLKKVDDMAKKATQRKVDDQVKKAAKRREQKPMVAASTLDDVAKKAAKAAAKRVGKTTVAAASFKAAANVFDMANIGYALQISNQTCSGVHYSHHLSRDIQPAKENMREEEEKTEKPGLVQCKISSVEGKYNHNRGKIPVAPIGESNFLGLPIRPGKKDCQYYMLNGFCKYESNCRFNHPDPTPVEGGDAPPVCGNGGSFPSQDAFQPTVPSDPVVFSPAHKVPPSNVEWNGYQNTTIMETPQPHSLLTTVVAPSPLASPTTTPALPTTIDGRLPVSPTTADGTPLTSPKVMEEDDPKLVKAARYKMLRRKMVKLCARSCELEAAYQFVDSMVDYMCAEVDKMFPNVPDSFGEGIERLEVVDPKFLQGNGLKKRVNLRKVKRRLRRKVAISKHSRLDQAMGA